MLRKLRKRKKLTHGACDRKSGVAPESLDPGKREQEGPGAPFFESVFESNVVQGRRVAGRWVEEWKASQILECLVGQVQGDRDEEGWVQDDEA